MAHYSRTFPAGIAGIKTIDAAELARIDENVSKAINGDEGGTWAPSKSPIVIGGAGLTVAMASIPTFITPISRTIAIPFANVCHSSSITPTATAGQRSTSAGAHFCVCLDDAIHDGATLTSVTMFFSIAVGRTGIPTALPALKVERFSRLGAADTPLSSADGGSGIVIVDGSSVANYEKGGALQSFRYVCDGTDGPNNVIDRTTWSYVATITDENGLNVLVTGGNQFFGAQLQFANITDMRAP